MNGLPIMRRALAAAATVAVVAASASTAVAQSSNTSNNSSTNTSTNTSNNSSNNTSNNTSAGTRHRADFVNGGVTQEEADQLRAQASSYPLEIQFASGNAFAADVHVRIADTSGKLVLVLPAAEPILLANLPPGRYTVEATYEGQTKRQQVTLGRGHQKLGFTW